MKVITVHKLEEKKEVKLQIRKVSAMGGIILFLLFKYTHHASPPFPFIILQTKRNENCECSEMKNTNGRDEGR